MNEGSLFVCLSHWDFPNHGTSLCTIGTIRKSSTNSRGAPIGFIMSSPMVEKLSNIGQFFHTKNHLTQKKNYRGILGMLLVLLESLSWVGFREGDVEKKLA